MIEGAEQCSVLQVISGGNDGIIHRHSCWAGFGCWLFSFFSYYLIGGLLYQVIEVFTKSAVHLLLHTHFY